MYGKNPPVFQWKIIGESVQGASHIRKGLPNQDSMLWEPKDSVSDEYAILAVSDGHSGARSFRSDLGSKKAVESATTVFTKAYRVYKKHGLEKAKEYLEKVAAKRILSDWTARIYDDLIDNPIKKEEIEKLIEKKDKSAAYAVYKNNKVVYGATLLASLITEEFIFYLRLGDGDIVVLNENPENIFKNDEKLGDETLSLCLSSALQNFEVSFQKIKDEPPIIVMLSTDGLSNSYSKQEGFFQIIEDISEQMQESGPAKLEKLDNDLNHASQNGSGDDITLVFATRTDIIKNFPDLKEDEERLRKETTVQEEKENKNE